MVQISRMLSKNGSSLIVEKGSRTRTSSAQAMRVASGCLRESVSNSVSRKVFQRNGERTAP